MGIRRMTLVLGAVCLVGCATTADRISRTDRAGMEEQVYTLGMWQVKQGRESEFVAAWKELSSVFASLPQPPTGKGILIQSATDPTLFYSFGPWRNAADIAAMRSDVRAQAGIQ